MAESVKIYDQIRKQWVERTPEEVVRQQVVALLLERGYPTSMISVEKSLSLFPHLKNTHVPLRRADVLVFRARGEELIPFLLIECKAQKCNMEAFRQLAGYNEFIGASFIALASKEGMWIFKKSEKSNYFRVEVLPSFNDI